MVLNRTLDSKNGPALDYKIDLTEILVKANNWMTQILCNPIVERNMRNSVTVHLSLIISLLFVSV